MALLLLMLSSCEGSTLRAPQRWEPVFPTFAAPVHQLLRDPTDPRRIYAACGRQSITRTEHFGGVLRSTDRGERWVQASRGIPTTAEVWSLAFAPSELLSTGQTPDKPAEKVPILLAGTHGAGLYASTSDGSRWLPWGRTDDTVDWERLTLQTILVLPGDPVGVAVGTKGRGVLVTEDHGQTWEHRNQGLLNLTIQGLTVDGEGNLLASTWYGGVYRSNDRGLSWSPLNPAYERIAVSSLTADGNVLWVGLQNGGLYAVTSGVEGGPYTFESQGSSLLDGVGILSIGAGAGRVVVGTSGHGVAIGRRGGRFVAVTEGLKNKTVSAVLLAPDKPDEVILGTWGGLYRSVPAHPLWIPAVALALLASLILVSALLVWRRSVPALARDFYWRLESQTASEVSSYWVRELYRLPRDRAPAILENMAVYMARNNYSVMGVGSEFIAGTAKVLQALRGPNDHTDSEYRQNLAAALIQRSRIFGDLTKRLESRPQGRAIAVGTGCMELQDALFAHFLLAESLGHVAALRTDLLKAEALAVDPSLASWVQPEMSAAFHPILDVIDQLSRLPSAEDRALFVGQALSLTLSALDDTERRLRENPTIRLEIGQAVFESLRELLATALQDIHQRAELKVTLRSKVLTTQREAVIVLELENVGQGHARNVAVELQPGKGFHSLRRRREVKSLLRNQSARLEFLVEPRVSDRVRLRFHLFYDDLERQGQRSEFADLVEFRQSGQNRTFRPLRPNPYVVGRPLLQSDVFLGREDVFARLESSLKGTHQDNVVVLIGARRMGKTSILRRLHAHLEQDYVAILIDLQGMIGSGETAFFRELASTICDELEELGIAVPEPPPQAFQDDPGSTFRREFLKRVRGALASRRLLLMFDEFEVLETRIRKGDLEPRILPYFRSLMQHEKHVSFIFAGTHRLDELTHDYWGALFNLAIYLDVGHLPEEEAKRLFTLPTQETFDIDPLALDKVYQLTGGHPHFSQLLARELVEYRNQQKLSYMTIQDVNAVADRVVDKGQLHISYLWEEGSRSDQLLLLATKELLDRKGMATLAAVDQYLSRHRIGNADPARSLSRMLRRQILSDNAGLLSFRMDLLKLWLDRHHNLESFLLSKNRDSEA